MKLKCKLLWIHWHSFQFYIAIWCEPYNSYLILHKQTTTQNSLISTKHMSERDRWTKRKLNKVSNISTISHSIALLKFSISWYNSQIEVKHIYIKRSYPINNATKPPNERERKKKRNCVSCAWEAFGKVANNNNKIMQTHTHIFHSKCQNKVFLVVVDVYGCRTME